MNTKTLFKLGTMLAILLVLVVGNAFAAKYYVNVVTGLDGYDGLSPVVGGIGVGPKATINNAIAAASPGDTIYVDYGNGNLYNEAVVVPKILTFGTTGNNGSGTPVIYSLNINIPAAAPNNTARFIGPWLAQQGLTLTQGLVLGGGNLTVAVSVTRVVAASTVDAQINYTGTVNFFYNATMTTGPEMVPATNTGTAGNLTTTAGNLTLGNSVTINGILNTAGNVALGGNILTVVGGNAHILGGNVTGGTVTFTLTGNSSVAGAFTLPVVTVSNSSSTARTLALPAITSMGNLTVSGASTVVNVTAATTVGNVSNSSTNILSVVTLTAATTTGSITNTGAGSIVFGAAAPTAVGGNVVQSGSGYIQFVNAMTISGSVTNNPALTIADGNAVTAASNVGSIRFVGDFVQNISGAVTNSPTFAGSLTNVATTWANGGEISFGSTTTNVTINGLVTVSPSRSFSKSSGTGATTISNNGKVLFATTTGNITLGGITNSTAWAAVTNTTTLNNGDVDMTARTTGIVSVGPVTSTSTGTGFANGNIFFGGVAGQFSAASISTSGGAGGQIYIADNTGTVLGVTGNVTNARTVAGASYLRFGTAPNAAFTLSIAGDVIQTGASTTAFDGYDGTGAFGITGMLKVSAGLVTFNAAAPLLGGSVNFGGIELTGGQINLVGAGAATKNVIIGNSTFTSGTFRMTTSAARTLQLGGLSNKFSGAATRTDFGTAAGDFNVTLLIQPTTITAVQTITGDATTTIWAGPMTVNNPSGLQPTVRFTGGNFRVLSAVNFALGQVEVNGMFLFVGGQLAPAIGSGSFTNTAGYITTAVGQNNGFVSMNGAAPQVVTGLAQFNNFEVDNGAGVLVDGTFKGVFNLTNGVVTQPGPPNIVFDNATTPPTIVRNAGTFAVPPTFTSMVNVYYIGQDKGTANELPVAADKLNNLTVATTNGAATAGKGTVNVAVATTVNGILSILPGQALVINGVNLTMKGSAIDLRGDLVNENPGFVGRLILDAPTGTAITGPGCLPDFIVNAGAVATITGPVGVATGLLGTDNIRGGVADLLPGTGGTITFLPNGATTSSLTVGFGTPNATTGIHLSGNVTTAAGATMTLGADLIGGNLVHAAGTVAIGSYTYTLGGSSNSITEGALTTSTTGKLLFSSTLVTPSAAIASSTNPFAAPRVFTTVSAHGFVVGQSIIVAGHSASGWGNGTYLVGAGSFGPTTFELTDLFGNVMNGNGGFSTALTGTVVAAPMLMALNTSAVGPAIDANVEVNLASSGNLFYLSGGGPLTISKNFLLTRGTMQLGSNAVGTNLILTGSTFTIGSNGSINTTGIGTLQLNATVPPMTMSYTGSPTLGNLRISNDVTLAGTGTGLAVSGTLTHDAGFLDFNSRTLTASGTYVRTAGTYQATTGYFVFSGVAFAKGTSGFSVPNLRLLSAVTVTGAAVLNVTQKLDINFAGTFNHDIAGAPTLSVADLVTVTWTNGTFDDPLTYAGTITLISAVGGANTVPATVWPASPTTLVTTFQLTGGGTTTLPGNRTVNTALWLTNGTLSLAGPRTLTMVDNSTVYRRDQGAITLGGGGLVYGTNMTVEYQNDGFFGPFPPPYFTTGPELPPTLANLTFTRSANVGNFFTLINSNVTVTGLLSIRNDVTDLGLFAVTATGNVKIEVDAFANATLPVVNLNLIFGGTGNQTFTVPATGATVQNLALNQTGTGSTVTIVGGALTVAPGTLTFVNGILVSGTTPIILGGPVNRTGVTGLSHIYGAVRRNIAALGRYEYPVGSMTQYRPSAITFVTAIPPAIGLTVQHVDSDPLGRLGLPAPDAPAGIRIGGYPPYYWLVMSTTSLGQSIPYDLEFVGTSPFGRPFDRSDDLRIIHRFDGNDLFNPWSLQGTGINYSNFLAVRPSGDTVVTVRVRAQLGGIVPEASRYTIGIPTRQPKWVVAPDSLTVNEGVALSSQFTADPQDIGETITYAVVSGPAGLAVSATGLVTWTPGYDQAGVKAVVLSAFDGEFTITKNVVITVVNVNRAPVFAPKTASFTKTDKDTLKVTLAATDADGDALTYTAASVTPAPTNAPTIAGALVTWKPAFADAGKTFTIIAVVSDGVTTGQGPTPGRDTMTVTVVVNRSRALGDADGNGTVQAADAAIVLQYVAGLITVTDPAQLWAMDASKNGTISAYDASLILQAAAGLIPPLSGNIADGGLGKGVVMQATGTLEMTSPEATTNPEVVKVGIKLSNPANVYSVSTVTRGDFNLVSIDAVNASLPEGWDMKWNVVGNELRIVAAGTTPLASGDVGTIMVHLKSKESRLSFSTDAMLNENFQSLGAVEVAAIPTVFALEQNYPNPFNPSTTIRYQIPNDASVNLVIYNVQGQKIRTLISKEQKAGYYSTVWDGRNEAGQTVSTGLYLYRVQAGSFVATQKMLMLK